MHVCAYGKARDKMTYACTSGCDGRKCEVLLLDSGNALPTAPAIYDLPLSLLTRLAAPLGPALAPKVAAAKLIARLQSDQHFAWAQQNGIVNAGGTRWLIAVVPADRAPNDSSPSPLGQLVRWLVHLPALPGLGRR